MRWITWRAIEVFVGSAGRVGSTGPGSVTRQNIPCVTIRAPGHSDESQTQAPLNQRAPHNPLIPPAISARPYIVATAQLKIGEYYLRGIGVEIDLCMAKKYAKLGAPSILESGGEISRRVTENLLNEMRQCAVCGTHDDKSFVCARCKKVGPRRC